MSLSPPTPPTDSRKRTSSFSCPASAPDSALAPSPRPTKTPRMGAPLRRQETMLSIDALEPCAVPAPAALPVPYYRTLQFYKDQRLKRKAVLNRAGEPITITTTPTKPPAALRPRGAPSLPPLPGTPPPPTPKSTPPKPPHPKPPTPTPPKPQPPGPGPPKSRRPPPQVILPSAACPVTTLLTPRSSSPLAPSPQTPRPARPVFPRTRAAPDLYRVALRARMARSPEGRRVLLMGARLAVSIDAATRELERIVNGGEGERERDRDGDVVMGEAAPPVLTASWVVVRGEDWEMVDCAA